MKKKIILLLSSSIATILLLEIILGNFYDFSNMLEVCIVRDDSIIVSNNSIVEFSKYYDEDFYPNIKENNKIIVAIGDSFTEGWPVAFEDQYTEILKNTFNSDSVDILNMGLGNTGPDQQIKIFQKHVLSRMIPDLVIWQFYPNDIWDSLHYPLFSLDSTNELVGLDGENNWLYSVHEFYSNISFLGKIRDKSYIIKFLAYSIQKQNKYKEVPDDIDDIHAWSIKKIKKEIDYMESLSKEYGFKLIYVLITPQLVYSSNSVNFPESEWILEDYRKLKKLFKDRELVEINFFSEIKNSTESGDFIIKKYFSDEERDKNPYGDRHFNESGYKLMSKIIYQSIVSSSQSADIK